VFTIFKKLITRNIIIWLKNACTFFNFLLFLMYNLLTIFVNNYNSTFGFISSVYKFQLSITKYIIEILEILFWTFFYKNLLSRYIIQEKKKFNTCLHITAKKIYYKNNLLKLWFTILSIFYVCKNMLLLFGSEFVSMFSYWRWNPRIYLFFVFDKSKFIMYYIAILSMSLETFSASELDSPIKYYIILISQSLSPPLTFFERRISRKEIVVSIISIFDSRNSSSS